MCLQVLPWRCAAYPWCRIRLELRQRNYSSINSLQVTMKTYTFHVSGTHCASCKILIEDILDEQGLVKNVHVNLKKETVEIETESEKSSLELAELLTNKIKPNGYVLSLEKIIPDSALG